MKANDLRKRRLARSQLIGAPLFIAQLGAYEIRQDLISGKEDILDKIGPHTVGTAAEFKKALGQAPPLEIIKFVNKPLFALQWLKSKVKSYKLRYVLGLD